MALFSFRISVLSALSVLCICISSFAADLEAGKRAYEQKDYATALREFKPLAQQGNPDAQVFLGKMYMKGEGVTKSSEEALKWYKSAAEQGNAAGQFFTGAIYLMNVQLRDPAQATKWLQLSAEQGMADAQVLLGMAYMKGDALPHDLIKADMWLRVAASQGDEFATGQATRAEGQMTADQIAQAHELAAAWKPKKVSP